jgi:hypothetical protein
VQTAVSARPAARESIRRVLIVVRGGQFTNVHEKNPWR